MLRRRQQSYSSTAPHRDPCISTHAQHSTHLIITESDTLCKHCSRSHTAALTPSCTKRHTIMKHINAYTIRLGAEERRVLRCGLASFLILSNPAVHVLICNHTGRHGSSAKHGLCTPMCCRTMSFQICSYLQIPSKVCSQKNLEIPAQPFFSTRQYCSSALVTNTKHQTVHRIASQNLITCQDNA